MLYYSDDYKLLIYLICKIYFYKYKLFVIAIITKSSSGKKIQFIHY